MFAIAEGRSPVAAHAPNKRKPFWKAGPRQGEASAELSSPCFQAAKSKMDARLQAYILGKGKKGQQQTKGGLVHLRAEYGPLAKRSHQENREQLLS